MYELIKIENTIIEDESVPTVNARELHEFLENGDKYATWIKDRIEKYDFLENKDFLSFSEKSEKGGRPKIEYHISLDMAKELAMVENNEKGRQARKYFIECEKGYKKTLENYIPKTLPDALEAYALELRKHEETKLLLKEALPKADVYDAIIESKNTFSMANTAQIINIEKMGRNKLLAWLRAKDILKSDNTPYRAKKLCFERRRLSEGEAIIQKYINKGWFEVRVTPTVNGPKACSRTTPKGIEGILHLLAEA